MLSTSFRSEIHAIESLILLAPGEGSATLLPDGSPSELSVSRVLTARDQNLSPEVYREAEAQIERDMQEGSDR